MKYPQSKWEAALQEAKEGTAKNEECLFDY